MKRISNFKKFFEASSNQYHWMILYQDKISSEIEDISWFTDLDEVYQYLKLNIFYNKDKDSSVDEEEVLYTNIPYNEWYGHANYGHANSYTLFKVGDKKESFEIYLDSEKCWNDFLDFYNSVPLLETFKKFLENSGKYNWLVTYMDYDSDEDFILWCEDMDQVYNGLRKNIFNDEDDEIENTNIPYLEWINCNTYLNIYKIGQNDPAFEIVLNSNECWNDFLNFYNKLPLLESKSKFPNIKKMEIDGFEVLMGKDADSNDYLTMQMRKEGDLWFHAHGFPGSHIILRVSERIPDQLTKRKVAELAAKNSKASGLATVICCPIELVSKEPGSNPGKVKVEMNLNVEKIDINL